MSEFFINSAKAVSVTGHRIMNSDLSLEKVERAFNILIENGYDTFLVGMAIGFDSICFCLLEKIRKEKAIKIIACIPCLTQAERFNLAQKKEYERMVSVADEKIVLSSEYTPTCMQKRNQFMVDNSSVVLSYQRRERGGTASTVRYAKKIGKKVIEI